MHSMCALLECEVNCFCSWPTAGGLVPVTMPMEGAVYLHSIVGYKSRMQEQICPSKEVLQPVASTDCRDIGVNPISEGHLPIICDITLEN